MDLRTQLPLTVLAGLYRARRALLHALHERLHPSQCRSSWAVPSSPARPLPRARRRCQALHEQYHARGCGRRRPHQLGRGGHELGAVWLGNFVGALALVTLVYFAHVADTGPMAKGMMSIAVGKLSADWTTIMIKGILCNPPRVPRRPGGLCGPHRRRQGRGRRASRLAASWRWASSTAWRTCTSCRSPSSSSFRATPDGVPLDVITIENIVKNLSAATVGNTIAGVVLVSCTGPPSESAPEYPETASRSRRRPRARRLFRPEAGAPGFALRKMRISACA